MARSTMLIGQSGGPTAVINSTLAGAITAARESGKVGRILGMVHGIQGYLGGEVIDLSGLSEDLLAALRSTPGAALGSCRYKVKDGDYERLLEAFRRHDVRWFFYIGGNDSMDTCHKVAALAAREGYEMAVIGLPKTIDNDLAETDHCPGFGSSARYIAHAVMDAGKDLEAMARFDDVCLLDVMGRNAGWLAAASVLGKHREEDPPHLVCLPEVPFDIEAFLSRVQEIHQRFGRVFVVVSEGIRLADGTLVATLGQSVKRDVFGHPLVTLSAGAAQYLADAISQQLGLQARVLRPGTLQRSCGSFISRTDWDEAFRVGQTGVRLAIEGRTDEMVTLQRVSDSPYRCITGSVALERVANAERKLPPEFIRQDGPGVDVDAFKRYALPLIGEPLARYVSRRGYELSW